jgi:hypothetical protein
MMSHYVTHQKSDIYQFLSSTQPIKACQVGKSKLAATCIYTNTIPYIMQNTQLIQNKYTN